MKIEIIEPEFTICKIDDLVDINYDDKFLFLSITDEETSLVCPSNSVPKKTLQCEHGWNAFRIVGTLDFSLIGILATITSLLASKEIGIFTISTYNTDYIFVKKENLSTAIDTLVANGYQLE